MITKKICVYGIVQGVGFRPFISRLAKKYGLDGSVCNKGAHVEIYVQGEEYLVAKFRKEIEKSAPERSSILQITEEEIREIKFYDFEIIKSQDEKGDIYISPDIAICDSCKRELYDVTNRRYMHPFINCTLCGPRLTILNGLPYDRVRTSMKEFEMCGQCADEYNNPNNRRYDAQPVCCNECGPEIYLLANDNGFVGNIKGKLAISYARQVIKKGGIVAIKGIGGFHLCCDAENDEAVLRLRQQKKRTKKPFAVMAKNIEVLKEICDVSIEAATILDGPEKPIILLKKNQDNLLSKYVAPDNSNIGVMLPYAPIHLLLFDYDDEIKNFPNILVMTSGNKSGVSICITDEEAKEELGDFCDVILSNNREIKMQCDDSVMSIYRKYPYMIRRSRGYAPLPIRVQKNWEGQVVATGGQLKNTICIGRNGLFYLSPYIGEMQNIKTIETWKKTVMKMKSLLHVNPQIVACDLHPEYNTSELAKELSLPIYPVQHHYAHILSCMADNDFMEPVIGVAFDGTGYGTDGTIWGGEILETSPNGFKRWASIVPFSQLGGELSVKEGYRIAVSIINSLYQDQAEEIVQKLGLCEVEFQKICMKMQRGNINYILSTSVGRLFDAVSAILGVKKSSTFEGEASMALQFMAEKVAYESETIDSIYPSVEYDALNDRFLLRTDCLLKFIIDEKIKGIVPVENLAYIFHKILANFVVLGCKKVREKTGINVCMLSGGVFQNLLLLDLCEMGLEEENFRVLKHHFVPTNDGGISLGQSVAAMAYLNRM